MYTTFDDRFRSSDRLTNKYQVNDESHLSYRNDIFDEQILVDGSGLRFSKWRGQPTGLDYSQPLEAPTR
jgi:hypothetical protein